MDLAQLEERARDRLGPVVYGYFAGGADDELTLADNAAAWNRIRLRPHVLRDVGAVSLASTVLGAAVPFPVLVAPMAYHRLAHPEGEAATAAGAAAAGAGLVVSTMATVPLEDVAKAAPGGLRWFQLYVHRDRGYTEELVSRAAEAGYQALVLTVDTPTLGNRRREARHDFKLPAGLTLANLVTRSAGAEAVLDVNEFARSQFDPTLTLDVIGWLRERAPLPVVVKGVLRGDDAAACVDAGASAVAVSNHGGRQLDTVVATADALPEVVEAVGGRAEVYVDGGVRRGTDVLKAVAMGARVVMVGRPVLWGLAVAGADGVRGVLDGLRGDTELAMALAGVPSLADVDRDLLAPPRGPQF